MEGEGVEKRLVDVFGCDVPLVVELVLSLDPPTALSGLSVFKQVSALIDAVEDCTW